MAHSLSGHITDENGQPITGVKVQLFTLDAQKQWTLLAEDTTKTVAGDPGVYKFDGLNPGRYEIQPDQASGSFDPQLITTGAGKNKTGLDFDQITLTDGGTDSGPNDSVDEAFMKDVLFACRDSVDAWAAASSVRAARQRLLRVLRALLPKSGETFLTAPDLDAGLSAGERSAKIREWQQQQYEMVDRIAAEADDDLGDEGFPLTGIACSVCRNRYYTPGTPYYMNYSALVQCMNNPPCT